MYKAYLQALPDGEQILVHFNPASLVYSVENSARQQAKDPNRRQFAGQFTGKLTMDLQFDTTGTGDDVRTITAKVAKLMESSAKSNKAAKGKTKGANKPAQPAVLFQWGHYSFKGFMESYKETIDFFSDSGVPLRSLVSIGLARQDKVFDEDQNLLGTFTGAGTVINTSAFDTVTGASTKMGDPKASRALAAANGLVSLRFTAGASLQVSGGVQLNSAAGFAADASVSTDAGLPISAGGGALFGSAASAGVPATMGAFAGLESGRAATSATAQLDPLRMMPATVGSDVSVDANASYSLGGAASSQSSFSADVGASLSFNDLLVFDNE
jgi:hypothetical protein